MRPGRDGFRRLFILTVLAAVAFMVGLMFLITGLTSSYMGSEIGQRAYELRLYVTIALGVLLYSGALFVLFWRDRIHLREQITESELAREAAQRAPFSLGDSIREPASSSIAIRELYFSPRWKTMLGYEPDEIGNTPEDWFRLVHPDDVEYLKATIAAHLRGKGSHFAYEHRMQHADGTYRWVLTRGLAVDDPETGTYRVVGSQSDITEQKRAEEERLHDSLHDVLTGLPNLALFVEQVEQTIAKAERQADYVYAVLLIDVDRFTSFVKIFGHPAGDALLQTVGERLVACIRPGDTLARLPGDSFAILLDNVGDVHGAQSVADRIQSKLNAPIRVNTESFRISASIGIAAGDESYTAPADVLRDAQIALDSAKSLDRSQYQVYDPRMQTVDAGAFPAETLIKRQRMENELRRAVEREEFEVRYQPIVSLRSGRITGLEVLLRWRHPERELLVPAQFADVANDTGIIVPVGQWVLRTACRQMRVWQDQFSVDPPLTIVVNLSIQQLMQPEFVKHIEQILAETDLEPSSLSLDITAGDVTSESVDLSDVLSELRSRDIRVHIDDFVANRTTLGRLQELPVDTIKVDRSFVEKMNRNGRNAAKLVNHAKRLGLHVTAEGLETNEQLSYLKELGVEDAQGFLLCDPLESETVVPLLAIFSA